MAEINVTLDKGENVVEVHAKRESPVINVEVIGSGPQGTPGADGYSPTITTEEITGGHRLTIIDKDHPEGQTVDVMDGQDGQDGADGQDGQDGRDGVDGQDGADGQDGQDGVSPEVSIGTITGGHSVTITDADHPTGQSFNVMDGQDGAPGQDGQDGADGQDGQDGVSPAVTVTDITGGHSVTITDADHPGGQSFNVMDGTPGPAGPGVPNGGAAGQMLVKNSGTDYDGKWDSNAYRAVSIPYGALDGTSTSTVMTATVPGITELRDGVCLWLKNGVVTSASGVTLNINSLGAKPIYSSMSEATAVSTTFAKAYTMLFVYDSTRVTGGCWMMSYGYYTNTTYTPPKLGFGYGTCSTAAATAAKTASITNYVLTTGGFVTVKFENDVPASATLNITSKGAKPIWYHGAAITDGIIKAGDYATFVYSGSYYHLVSIDRIPEYPTEIFWCTYGTTTKSDIDDALTAGKLPMVIRNGVTYVYAYYGTNAHYFGSTGLSSMAYQYVTCNDSSTWASNSVGLAPSNVAQVTINTSYENVSEPVVTLDPCPVTYDFGECDELTVTVTATTQYHFSLVCPSGTPTVLTMTGIIGTSGDTLEAGKRYEVDIWNGVALIKNIEVTPV